MTDKEMIKLLKNNLANSIAICDFREASEEVHVIGIFYCEYALMYIKNPTKEMKVLHEIMWLL